MKPFNNSYERRKNKKPAYYVTEFGVLKEIDQQLEGSRPLYWKPEPLPEARIAELKQMSESPLHFARLIEKELFGGEE